MLLTVLSLRSQNIRMQSRLGQARLSRNFRRTKEIPDCDFSCVVCQSPSLQWDLEINPTQSWLSVFSTKSLASGGDVGGVARVTCAGRGLELRAADTTTEPVYIWTECHRVSYTSAANLTPLQHGRDGCRGDL